MKNTLRPVALSIACLTLLLSRPMCAAEEPQKSPTKRLNETASPERNTVKIRLTIDGKTLTASLNDTPAARDFLSLLPLTLTLEDYASTEKIAYLPRKLTTKGAPAGFTPSAGDITYYAPWGNLAIFHKDFRYSEGLISLGRIDSGGEALRAHGTLRAMIERIEK
jgi:hypothetical protein